MTSHRSPWRSAGGKRASRPPLATRIGQPVEDQPAVAWEDHGPDQAVPSSPGADRTAAFGEQDRSQALEHPPEQAPGAAHGGWGHRLLMLVCCIPMLIVVVALVASGVAGAGSIVFALVCVAMMALMMFMMPGGHKH